MMSSLMLNLEIHGFALVYQLHLLEDSPLCFLQRRMTQAEDTFPVGWSAEQPRISVHFILYTTFAQKILHSIDICRIVLAHQDDLLLPFVPVSTGESRLTCHSCPLMEGFR